MNPRTIILATATGALVATMSGTPNALADAASVTPATTSLRQHVELSWDGGRNGGHDRATFGLPGIGRGEIVCRPDATYLRIKPLDASRETSLWSVVDHTSGPSPSWAVRNARVYSASTPTATGSAGTGSSTQEGFNQVKGVEDSARGTMRGLISQRTALNAAAAATAPVTAFSLSWGWSGFDGAASGRRCAVTADFTTVMPAGATFTTHSRRFTERGPGPAAVGLQLDWHGDADAAAGKTSTGRVQLPYVGALSLRCPTGRDADAALVIDADDPSSGLSATARVFEGSSTEPAERSGLASDPTTGQLHLALPVNGSVQLVVSSPAGRAVVDVASWRKGNDRDGAANFCQIAAQGRSLLAS